MPPERITSILAGVAGEYYVAAELSRRGIIASITLRNTRGTDILATKGDGTLSATIQVKTTRKKRASWILNEKAETYASKRHFYVFVCLGEVGERPEFYVVPSKVVARFTRTSHARWLAAPNKDGKPHNDSSMRKFKDLEEKYLERWDILAL
jgi:hypothetical protein